MKWRRGSLMLVAAVALVPAVTSLAVSMNYGQASQDRHVAQDGADALANMHAVWTARSLNQISMNNVQAVQLTTVAIGSEALDEALGALELQAGIAITAIGIHSLRCPGFGWPPAVAACFAAHVGYAVPAVDAIAYVSRTQSDFAPDHGIRVSHDGLAALDAMNRDIVARFPRAVGEMAEEYLPDLRLEAAHYADPCAAQGRCGAGDMPTGMSLPVEPGGSAARATACLGLRFGTLGGRTTFQAKGFALGTGPMSAGGSTANPDVQSHINVTTGIGGRLERLYTYLDDLYMVSPSGPNRFPRYANFLLSQDDGGGNAFSRRFVSKEVDFCTGFGGIYPLDAPVPEFWRPVGGEGQMIAAPADMPEAYQILALAQNDRTSRVGLALLTEPEDGHFAYAQATAFNPDGISLFSQNWRAERMPARRVDTPAVLAEDLRRDAPAAFQPLANVLADLTADMGGINAH